MKRPQSFFSFNNPTTMTIGDFRKPGEYFFLGRDGLNADKLVFILRLSLLPSPSFPPRASFFPPTLLDAAVPDSCNCLLNIALALWDVLRVEKLGPWPSYLSRFEGSLSSTTSSSRRHLRSCFSELCSSLSLLARRSS